MTNCLRVACVLALAGLSVSGQEKVTFTTPVFTDAGASEFRVGSVYFNSFGHEIRAVLNELDPGTTTYKVNGRTLTCTYADTQADNLLKVLNKADFSVTSMQRQVMKKCQDDGKLGAGTITGTPQ